MGDSHQEVATTTETKSIRGVVVRGNGAGFARRDECFDIGTLALILLVAVPAVWAFNYFTNKVEAFDVEMDNSSMELINYFILRRGARK